MPAARGAPGGGFGGGPSGYGGPSLAGGGPTFGARRGGPSHGGLVTQIIHLAGIIRHEDRPTI